MCDNKIFDNILEKVQKCNDIIVRPVPADTISDDKIILFFAGARAAGKTALLQHLAKVWDDSKNPFNMNTCYGCIAAGKCAYRTQDGCPDKMIRPFGEEAKLYMASVDNIGFKKEYQGTWTGGHCRGICSMCHKKNDCPDRDVQVFKKEDIDKCTVAFTDKDIMEHRESLLDITYSDIYIQLLASNPALKDAVNDYRPEGYGKIRCWLKNDYDYTLLVSMSVTGVLSYEWREYNDDRK